MKKDRSRQAFTLRTRLDTTPQKVMPTALRKGSSNQGSKYKVKQPVSSL